MPYLLDSNAWIACLRQKSPEIIRRLEQLAPADVLLCSLVVGELLYGAIRSGPAYEIANRALVEQLRQRYASLPFDDAAAETYARLRAELTTQGMMIGPNDLLIAAIALANRVTLVTHNTAEFRRVNGLLLEDWQAP